MVAGVREYLPHTPTRVTRNTAEEINEAIQRQIDARVEHYAAHPDEIDERLHALDQEWDIERTLEANAAGFGFAGVLLGALADRRFLVLPGLVTGFLMQHALQGWCPPVPLFRRLGVRTAAEIETERTALKALRGDFDEAKSQRQGALRALLDAVRR